MRGKPGSEWPLFGTVRVSASAGLITALAVMSILGVLSTGRCRRALPV